MTEVEILNTAKAILKDGSLDGLDYRDRYCPKICCKCGKNLEEAFRVEINGVSHCQTCELPVKKNRDEITKEYLDSIVAGLKNDGELTIAHIQVKLGVVTPSGLEEIRKDKEIAEAEAEAAFVEAQAVALKAMKDTQAAREKAETILKKARRVEKAARKIEADLLESK